MGIQKKINILKDKIGVDINESSLKQFLTDDFDLNKFNIALAEVMLNQYSISESKSFKKVNFSHLKFSINFDVGLSQKNKTTNNRHNFRYCEIPKENNITFC